MTTRYPIVLNGSTIQELQSSDSLLGSIANISGGDAGSIPYQSATNLTTFVNAGLSGQLLQSNGTGAPTWISGVSISTGVSGLGTNVATFLASPSSVNLALAVSDETGSGALVFANTPTLVSPILGTPASGVLGACTVDGINKVGYLNIPQSGSTKTSSYTLATTDSGEFIEVGTGGSIVVPNSTFTVGDAVVIFNNTSSAITLTMSIATAYIGGTDSDKATISLATRGVCNVMFISDTVCVVTGNVT
jgi:hypothetical protein